MTAGAGATLGSFGLVGLRGFSDTSTARERSVIFVVCVVTLSLFVPGAALVVPLVDPLRLLRCEMAGGDFEEDGRGIRLERVGDGDGAELTDLSEVMLRLVRPEVDGSWKIMINTNCEFKNCKIVDSLPDSVYLRFLSMKCLHCPDDKVCQRRRSSAVNHACTPPIMGWPLWFSCPTENNKVEWSINRTNGGIVKSDKAIVIRSLNSQSWFLRAHCRASIHSIGWSCVSHYSMQTSEWSWRSPDASPIFSPFVCHLKKSRPKNSFRYKKKKKKKYLWNLISMINLCMYSTFYLRVFSKVFIYASESNPNSSINLLSCKSDWLSPGVSRVLGVTILVGIYEKTNHVNFLDKPRAYGKLDDESTFNVRLDLKKKKK